MKSIKFSESELEFLQNHYELELLDAENYVGEIKNILKKLGKIEKEIIKEKPAKKGGAKRGRPKKSQKPVIEAAAPANAKIAKTAKEVKKPAANKTADKPIKKVKEIKEAKAKVTKVKADKELALKATPKKDIKKTPSKVKSPKAVKKVVKDAPVAVSAEVLKSE